MIIMCVLVVLATLIGHSESAVTTCKTATAWGTVGDVQLTDAQACTSKCARPKLLSATAYETEANGAKWGCGACDPPENCVYCDDADDCNIQPTFECRTSKDDNTAKSLCPDKAHETAADGAIPETECKRTLWDGANFGSTANGWGCGGCAENAEDCVACTGNLCNNVEGGDTPTHKCHQYTKNSESTFYEKAGSTKDCHEATPGCKMPAAEYDETANGAFEVCGNDCPENTAETCRGCDEAECNDVASSSVFMCKQGEGNTASDGVDALNSIFCDSACTRPTVAYGKAVADPAAYGCGDCSGVNNCVSCTTKNCNTFPTDANSHQCFEWTWDATNKWTVDALKDCQAGVGEHKCNMPKKATDDQEQTDIDAALGGCGPCAADPSETCTTTAPEQNKEGTHQCHTWEWKSADKKWEFSKATINCYTGTSEETKKCSLPKDRSKETGFVATGACSKCGTDTTANANCMDSAPGENSGPRVLFSLLALALPIFYALL